MNEKAATSLLQTLSRKCAELMLAPPAGVAWHESIAAGDFQGALTLVEQQLNDAPQCAGARLWWVRCQLELGRLPITALTSPLEEILPEVRQTPPLHLLGVVTFLKTAVALLDRSQSRLAVVMLEHAVEFADLSDAVTAEEAGTLDEFLLSALEDELKRAQQRRETKKYIDALEDKVKAQRERKKSRPRKKDKPQKRETVHRAEMISAKSIVSEAISPEISPAEPAFVQAAAGEIDQLLAPPPPPPPAQEAASSGTASKNTLSLGFVLFVSLLLAVGLGGWFSWRIISRPAAARPVLAMEIRVPAAQAMSLPGLDGATGGAQGVNATLDEVGKRLQQLAVTKNKESAEQKKEKEAIVPGSPAEVDQKALSPSNAKSLAAPREDELEPISGLPPAKNDIPANRVPKPNAGQFANTKVEEVGSSPRKAELPPELAGNNLRVSSNGRIYGPPKTQGQPAPSSDATTLDGSPFQPYEVQQFKPPLRFRTITATDVLSAPSVLATSMARLEPNTPVDVSARMGHWLELRSSKGHVGYIYAQDAEEERHSAPAR